VRKTLLWAAFASVVLGSAVSAALAAPSKFVAFKTPSGNIGCIYADGPHYLRCDIRSRLKPRPPHPQGCQGEYGDSISMNRFGRAHLVCHGDTALDPRARIVRYGSTLRVGPFACTSRMTGLTCSNASGRGFFLSRERYRLF
jgi:uncharacterized protein DUF6636